jgi:RsiW-degrading membrane proteinase PrsW (M82 family)
VLLAAALLPLVFQMLQGSSDTADRFERTMAGHPEIVERLENVKSEDELFSLLPNGRIEGAHLSHETWTHWAYAVVAASIFIGVVCLSTDPSREAVMRMIVIAAVTSTVGILSLIIFQWIAEFTQGFWVRGRGIVMVLFYIAKFIGFSYRSALDESNGFWLSFLGFTFGVGLCEELTKVLPAIFWLDDNKKLGWKSAGALGLCSGVGFGAAEGIMYSSQYYNGVATLDIYLTRFVSCVALHAVWAASASILAKQSWNRFEDSARLYHILYVIAVPAVLHGLYDTLLKKDMPVYALVTALASLVWLAITIEFAMRGEVDASSGRLRTASTL